MQIPTIWTVVTSVAHVQVRQVQDCEAIVSSVSAQMPPMPTVMASLLEAAKTDVCTMTAAISYESEIEEYQTKVDEWLKTESNASLIMTLNACDDYMESSYSSLYAGMTTCAPPKDGFFPSDSPQTASAAPTKSAATTSNGSTTSAQTGATSAATGAASSATGAASSAVPAAGAGARSTTSMVLAAGAFLLTESLSNNSPLPFLSRPVSKVPPHKMPVYCITGSNRGIGLELVRQIAAQPDTTILALTRTLSNNLSDLEAVKASSGAKVHILECDIGNPDSISNLASSVTKTLGRGM
ncbi:hypothetical protein MCOR27_005121 [Pyricularia oryzae]|uniref:Ketoreductase (KR) domain-containing protein n=1 Tax=Pyricularia grisea TaxID=148305 RepID=A0ABQ8NGK2_PYRGI|nr:hypothetical protein MCOR01_011593 [Pyricularia oryzae]KAI6296753.1 hypothetical protein MCOR33_006744 [Pyricularia grisea]KAI6254078.1 hypothetical protein MCOR19_009397 [Pyricularia oryzae]KAI6276395.1 hypothetical protein MCOR26_005609 [Pyricularia oryzae]KAI6279501.1 hypothetical protein MCOR27_005121 [Pyricularia oryzae]